MFALPDLDLIALKLAMSWLSILMWFSETFKTQPNEHHNTEKSWWKLAFVWNVLRKFLNYITGFGTKHIRNWWKNWHKLIFLLMVLEIFFCTSTTYKNVLKSKLCEVFYYKYDVRDSSHYKWYFVFTKNKNVHVMANTKK